MSEDIKKGLLGIVVDETTISQVMQKKKKVAQAKYDAVLDDVLNARMDLVRATAELQNKLREVASVYGIPPDQAGTWVMNEVRKMREAGFRDGSKILQLLKAAELPRGS